MRSARNAGEKDMFSFLISLRVVKSSLNLANKAKVQTSRPFTSSNKQRIKKPGLRSIDCLKPQRNKALI